MKFGTLLSLLLLLTVWANAQAVDLYSQPLPPGLQITAKMQNGFHLEIHYRTVILMKSRQHTQRILGTREPGKFVLRRSQGGILIKQWQAAVRDASHWSCQARLIPLPAPEVLLSLVADQTRLQQILRNFLAAVHEQAPERQMAYQRLCSLRCSLGEFLYTLCVLIRGRPSQLSLLSRQRLQRIARYYNLPSRPGLGNIAYGRWLRQQLVGLEIHLRFIPHPPSQPDYNAQVQGAQPVSVNATVGKAIVHGELGPGDHVDWWHFTHANSQTRIVIQPPTLSYFILPAQPYGLWLRLCSPTPQQYTIKVIHPAGRVTYWIEVFENRTRAQQNFPY